MREARERRIAVLDLRGERGAVLRTLLEPFGAVAIGREPGELCQPPPALLVIDPPADGLGARRLLELLGQGPAVPVLLIGRQAARLPAQVRVFTGPLHPSRLRAAVAELLESAPGGAPSLLEQLARLVPLEPAARERLARCARFPGPVLLSGPPGSGKSLLARDWAAREGRRFRMLLLREGAAPPDELDPAWDPDTLLYVSGLDTATPQGEGALTELCSRSLEGRLKVVVGVADAASTLRALRDDLRLLLEPAWIEVPALSADAEGIADRLGQVLAVLAGEREVPAPELTAETRAALAAHSWPLHFEELVSRARRALLGAAGKPLRPGDLGLDLAAESEAPPRRRSGRVAPEAAPSALDDLVQELAHEIKNPLVSVKTFTQLLPERYEDPEFREQYYRLVSADVDRIDAVLAELEEYTRLRDPQREALELGPLVARAVETWQFQFRKRNIEVSLRVPDRWGALTSDPELLGYVFDGVLRESLNAMPEGARMEISPAPGRAARGRAILLRYRRVAESGAVPTERERRPRQVIGLRHSLAARVLRLLGGALTIEDTLEGETRVTLSIHDLA